MLHQETTLIDRIGERRLNWFGHVSQCVVIVEGERAVLGVNAGCATVTNGDFVV